jgi:riboflavin-specific deaminase-like protein
MEWVSGLSSVQQMLTAEDAWQLLRLAARASLDAACQAFAKRDGDWRGSRIEAADVVFDERFERGWSTPLRVAPEARQLLDLHAPLCVGERARHLVIGHLGQSLDGRIATRTGSSQFITGAEDLAHTHRLRALCDAVVVGARTVIHDDPRLTTRLVAGEHPTRVVLDPQGRLCAEHGVFSDGEASTLLVISEEARPTADSLGHAEIVRVPGPFRSFALDAVLKALRDRGLLRVFIEGGGVTVSRFLAAGLLDRLHVTVAPVILGSGLPALELPPIDVLAQAMRVHARHFSLGTDVLFDCDLRASVPANDQ